MEEDIRNQPESLAGVVDYQLGSGYSALQRAEGLLKSAPRIVVTGMGASLFSAMPFANRLVDQGLNANLIEASELLHYHAQICKDAAVVLVSRSGESVEILKLLPILRDLGAKTIGVTNESNSTLAKTADCSLLVNSRNDEMVAVQTYTGTALALLLLKGVIDGKSVNDLRKETAPVLSACADGVKDFLDGDFDWRNFFEGACVVHILGRGPSLASVQEGALLFNETAKLASVAAPSGSFRHGPVEIVDKNFRGIVFATHGKTRDLDLALASDLERMGAKVNIVGNGGSWPIPGVQEFYLPIVEIVPVQVAALRASELRGILAGQFRYVSKVTSSETGFMAY
jgi:glucosamine--fructose-6-phosphate aminotransferase (isomerizing)